MKIAGILLLCTAAGLAGFRKAEALRRRTIELDGLMQLVDRACGEARYFRTPAWELLHKLTGLEEFCRYRAVADYGVRLAGEKDISAAWRGVGAHGLSEEDRQIMFAFTAAFGKTDMEGQRDICAGVLERLRRQREQAQREFASGARLYRSLGLLGGAFIAIVLI